MAQNYIGKIAGIVTLNTRDVTRGVNDAKDQLDAFGNSIQKVLGDANRRAGKSFDAIFTPIQKLQAAMRAIQAQSATLAFPKESIDRANNFARAVESLFSPLKRANDAFRELGLADQNRLQNELNKTLQVVGGLTKEINDFGTVSETRVQAAEQRVRSFAASVQAAADAVESLQNDERARLAVANTRLPVMQRESDLMSMQGASTDVRERLAAIDRLRRGEEERELAAARALSTDQARLAVANTQLTVLQRESDLLSRQGEVSDRDPSGRTVEQRIADIARQRAAEEDLARTREAAAARAEMASRRLQVVLTDEVEATNARTRAANAALAGNGGRTGDGIALGIDQRQLTRLNAEVDLLQTRLVGVSQEARGPAVAAIEAYRQRVVQAFRDGSIATHRGQEAIAGARQEMTRLVAAAAGVSARGLARELQRVGDVSTRVGARGALAMQQLIFAIDDAASVTGGLEQRVRAAGNNITQFGVLVGGTAGLVSALAVTIGAQLVLAYIKAQNAGVTAEDRIKSLNKALERQKSAVEALAEAYKAVADAIRDAGQSEADRSRRSREGLVDEVRRAQEERRNARAGSARSVQREQAFQTAKQRELEQTDNPGKRFAIERELEASRRREAAARGSKAAAPGISPSAAVDAALATIGIVASNFPNASEVRGSLDPLRDQDQAAIGAARNERQRMEVALGVIERSSQYLERQRAPSFWLDPRSYDPNAIQRNSDIDEAQAELARIEADLRKGYEDAADAFILAGTNFALSLADAIGETRDRLAEATGGKDGVVGSRLKSLGRQLEDAQRRLKEAADNPELAEAITKEIEGHEKLREELFKAADNVLEFADALKKASGNLFDTLAGERRSAADQARRDANRAGGVNDPDQAFFRRQSQRLEEAAREEERRAADQQAVLDRLAAQYGGVGNIPQEELDRERGKADRRDVEVARQREQERRLAVGQAALRPEIAGLDTLRGLQAVLAEAVEAGDEARAALARTRIKETREDIFRGLAPTLFGLQDAVQNAILQGPSRAALNPTDVSTVEGSRELTRLLRGDDEARNQDLVAISKESLEVQKAIRDNLDLRNAI